MGKLSNLKPEKVWKYFEEICQVPRPSKKEDKIVNYLIKFGTENKLQTKVDYAGNVLITKRATKGMENKATLVLQSHVDMVCEKNSDVKHDFDKDPIIPYIDGDWVKAKGTTLGADDGIGMAAQLAILASDDIEHPKIECLFTSDEETGLSGAIALGPNFFTGKILINLDSEDEGEIFIGCAGGTDTTATFEYKKEKINSSDLIFNLKISGLRGGHSGDDIHKGFGNSIKIATRFLIECSKMYEIRLISFEGGNLRNAIPREAEANFTVPKKYLKKLTDYTVKFSNEIKNELKITEPDLKIICENIENNFDSVINKEVQDNLLNALQGVWHGVVEMSRDIPDLVETSTNLASIKHTSDNTITVATSQRSSVESQKKNIAQTVESVFLLSKATIKHSDGYPGWQPNPDSKILEISSKAYKKLFGIDPKVKAIHAGLECGLFLEKYPELDMISIGPTLRNVHSPDEKISIESTLKFWEFLLYVIKNAPDK